MVELKCDKGYTEVTMSGSAPEICADVLTLVHVVFKRIFEENVVEAMTFRAFVEANIDEVFTLRNEEIEQMKEEDEDE